MKRINSIQKLFSILPKVLCWIRAGFNLPGVRPSGEFEFLLRKLELVSKTRGQVYALQYMKDVRLVLMSYLSGSPCRVPGVRSTKDGIPLILGPLVDNIRRGASPATLQMLTTILYSTRALSTGRQPDITPIISPHSVTVADDFGKYAKSFWKELGYLPSQQVPKSLLFKRYHLTTKQGPNGQALWSSLKDLYSLPESLLESICALGGELITERIEVLFKMKPILAQMFPVDGTRYRKISYFPDKETKVRVIAILDYWSQTVLKPLHSYLFRLLSKIHQDQTFDQGSFKDKVKDWPVYYSVDLTAATDRFPIQVIASVLKAKLPESYVNHWINIMVGFPFDFDGKQICYAVGNPMGAYSSWASFAVAHHYVMYYCCRELKIQWSDAPYCLLGDDIVIGSHDLGKLYLSVVKSLGVEVSALKTHISPHTLEFAKRWIHKGQEITPFPVSSLKEGSARSYILTSNLLEAETKGWLATDGIPSLVKRFYGVVTELPSRLTQKFHDQSHLCELMIRVMRGDVTASDCLNAIARHHAIPIRLLADEESSNIISSLAVEAFADSNPENEDPSKTKGIGLGPLAIHLVQTFTGFEEPDLLDLGLKAIYALPLLGAYALIEEMFMNLKREAFRIDTTGGGDWPMLMRTMALPWDDRIFTQRSSHLIAKASAVLGKKVKERLELIIQLDPSFHQPHQ